MNFQKWELFSGSPGIVNDLVESLLLIKVPRRSKGLLLKEPWIVFCKK